LCRGGLVCRYDTGRTDDGVGGGEGAFVAACYWLAEVLFMQGREDDARALFERVTARASDLGLLAEELAFDADLQLGNYPQALSHLSLVAAAQRLYRPECPPSETRRESSAPTSPPSRATKGRRRP
jgi:GH15 family glucan-1,4-alpha-glucosidase